MSKNNIITTENLSKSFGHMTVVDHVNLVVSEGAVFGFLGPNGSGKTTTIRMLLGLVQPTSGEITLNGYNVLRDYVKAIREVGAIAESPSAYTYLTGRENMHLKANMYGGISEAKITEVLKLVNLEDRSKDKVRKYSLGMKQRLGIAMALLNNPKLVILDEPMNGLDPQGIQETKDLILMLNREQGITFFISSHLLAEIEQICSSIAILQNGKMIAQGELKHFLQKDTEICEVFTPDIDRAINIIGQLKGVKVISQTANAIVVEFEVGSFARINEVLLTNNVLVTSFHPRKKSLEQYYIEVINRGVLNDPLSAK